MEVQRSRRGINGNRVSFLNQGDGTAHKRLWSNVAHHHPVRTAGKATIGDQSY